jgi:multidrug efflux pump subunit AcrA (membrane-fusion protein)
MAGVKKRFRRSRLSLPRRPLEWGLAVLAVALVAIAITSLGSGSSSSSAATRRTATSGKGVVQSTVSGNGTLEPAQKVELSFGASGEVTAIYVKAGEEVTKGKVLAEIDSSSARASLASAEAQLLEAEEAVEKAAEAEEEESEEVAYTGGASAVSADLTTEATATAATASAEETTTPAADEKEGPGKEETATPKAPQEVPSTEAESGASTEEMAPESTVESSAPSGAAESGAAGGTTVSLPTAEANLREAELTLKSARQEVRETTLRAPFSGTIAQVSGSVGETVSSGSSSSGGGGSSEASISGPGASGGGSSESSGSFMVLAQVHRLKMEVSFSESDIGKVRKGQTATVSVSSMEGTELAGEVVKVGVLPSEGSSSVVEYPATILVTQSAKGVRAGMSASAEVVVEQVKDAITVPSEAITGKSVTVEEDGKEVTKSVETGLVGDETTQVISGLKPSETLILPETTVATGGLGGEGGSESGAFPGGGAFPSLGGGGFSPPSGGFAGGAP